MPNPFLKFVKSLDELHSKGVDENFFQGKNYLSLPDKLSEPFYKYCLEGASSASVKIAEAEDSEPLEVFVFDIKNNSRKKIIHHIGRELTPQFRKIIMEASEVSTRGDIMSSKMNEPFDDLRQMAEVRDFLMQIDAEVARLLKAKVPHNMALLVYV